MKQQNMVFISESNRTIALKHSVILMLEIVKTKTGFVLKLDDSVIA